jgi:AAA domain
MTELTREFLPLPSVDGYMLELTEAATTIRVERLRRERGELVGELSVSCSLPGTRSRDGMLSVADFNLSSARARTDRGKLLAERSQAPTMDWSGILEEFCQHVIREERIGLPIVLLSDIPRPDADHDDVEVDVGVRLLRRHPVTLFGDGGDAKSYIGLYWATRLAAAGLRVGYVDWEFSGEDHRDRLERICGPDMPAIWYARCERPLVHEVDRLERAVRVADLDYLILDSVAFASDGPPEAAEVASAYFRALRRLGVGTLNIAHTTKSADGDAKPFGSTFWHNGSRSTWYIKRGESSSSDRSRLTLGLFNRKSNVGPIAPAVGYSVTFGPDRTTFVRTDLADTPDLAERLPTWQRMAHLLRGGSLTMAQVAVELEVPVDTIVKTTKRHEGKVFVRVPGTDGVYRIGLLDTRNVA